MPIVFVHGVGTRRGTGKAYDRRVAARTALLRRFLGPTLGLDPKSTRVFNPYWGSEAATFRWDHASLPGPDVEAFGAPDDPTSSDGVLAEAALTAWEEPPPPDRTLLATARMSAPAAVDLLWTVASEVEWIDSADVDSLAGFAYEASRWADGVRATDLIDVGNDPALFGRIVEAVERADAAAGDTESFGVREATVVLREALDRIRTAGPRFTSAVAGSVLRRRVHTGVATFMGDVLAYLRQREQSGADGPIASTVTADLRQAHDARTDADPHVVVVAHSMGGNIVFDLLSHLRPDLSCDVLVTVGSQVGLFAELDLLPAVAAPAVAARDRSPRPASIGRWLNVFDECDVLSFAASGVFSGVDDFAYSTGYGLLKAHSSYFVRPSFFRRLGARLEGGA
ncbi:hypothetical protein GCM10009541_54050 [Micromonospora gifhornensis]|uniref:PGAP1-like protein n=1 Tax=Micromonospora gifhornensis TaxID=84594 RepID=A0ABQ4IKE7_9ACTN|nr:hypothetical protein [Micromonospora gifhornensis]GIJ18386.1 hypothetical protein Vgi01_50700 [Micromonospora gifhornensis]